MNERRCPKCQVMMTDGNSRRKKSGHQLGQFVTYCNPCYTTDTRERSRVNTKVLAERDGRKRDRFSALVKSIKSERPCYDCGGVFPPEGMDFDHVSGKKIFQIAQGYHKSWTDVRMEIDKCQLVCAVCHRVRTKQRS